LGESKKDSLLPEIVGNILSSYGIKEVYACKNEDESWDTIWKWLWFTREMWMDQYWEEVEEALRPLFPLLRNLNVSSILDSSCGLGFKTIMFAKRNYEVEGSDQSAVAIRYAPILAEERGFKIRFFRSRFDELGGKCMRKYDCVYSDYFDELKTYGDLRASAEGVYSVLNEGGKFVFYGPSPKLERTDLKELIEREWCRRMRFNVHQPFETGELRVIHIEVLNKMSEGILENHIFIIEGKGVMRAEIASIMNPRIKWTLKDYVDVLEKAGFSRVEFIEREKGEGFVIAVK